MQLNKRTLSWILVGTLFALGTAMIHYQVKVKMAGGGRLGNGRVGALRVGSESPDFSARDLEGRPVVLSEFHGRKVVVLDFWATWCAPCLKAMPTLQELDDEFNERGVEVLAVNLGEEPDHVQRFLERNGYSFRVVADQDQTIGDRFGVGAIPAQLVVSADGRIEWAQVGYEPWKTEQLRQLLERLTKDHQSDGSAPAQESNL